MVLVKFDLDSWADFERVREMEVEVFDMVDVDGLISIARKTIQRHPDAKKYRKALKNFRKFMMGFLELQDNKNVREWLLMDGAVIVIDNGGLNDVIAIIPLKSKSIAGEVIVPGELLALAAKVWGSNFVIAARDDRIVIYGGGLD